MSLDCGWDFEDDLDDLFEPETKFRAFLNLLTLPIRLVIVCLLVIPFSYFIAVIFGFFYTFRSLGKNKEKK